MWPDKDELDKEVARQNAFAKGFERALDLVEDLIHARDTSGAMIRPTDVEAFRSLIWHEAIEAGKR